MYNTLLYITYYYIILYSLVCIYIFYFAPIHIIHFNFNSFYLPLTNVHCISHHNKIQFNLILINFSIRIIH